MTISDFDGAVFWPGVKAFVANAGIEPISLGEPEDEVWSKIFAAAAAVGSPLSLGMSPPELMRAAYALAQGGGGLPSVPTGFQLLQGRDGAYLKSADGSYLYGRAA